MIELTVDNFAGGGGASFGIEAALGRPIDFAINHDREAVAMHAANHPKTKHYCEDVWQVDPLEVTQGKPVGLAWFSPDCKHFSRAKGGKPVSKRVRGLAWIVIRWAKAVRPRVIMLENVSEFATWGPLLEDGSPCPKMLSQPVLKVGEFDRTGLVQCPSGESANPVVMDAESRRYGAVLPYSAFYRLSGSLNALFYRHYMLTL